MEVYARVVGSARTTLLGTEHVHFDKNQGTKQPLET